MDVHLSSTQELLRDWYQYWYLCTFCIYGIARRDESSMNQGSSNDAIRQVDDFTPLSLGAGFVKVQ